MWTSCDIQHTHTHLLSLKFQDFLFGSFQSRFILHQGWLQGRNLSEDWKGGEDEGRGGSQIKEGEQEMVEEEREGEKRRRREEGGGKKRRKEEKKEGERRKEREERRGGKRRREEWRGGERSEEERESKIEDKQRNLSLSLSLSLSLKKKKGIGWSSEDNEKNLHSASLKTSQASGQAQLISKTTSKKLLAKVARLNNCQPTLPRLTDQTWPNPKLMQWEAQPTSV